MIRCAFLLLLVCTLTRGITILSTLREAIVINGELNYQNSVSIECGIGDYNIPHEFTIQSSTGVVHKLTIECDQPLHYFDIQDRGFVSEDGQLLQASTYTVRDFARFTGVNTSLPQTPPIIGRQLLSIDEAVHISRNLLQFTPGGGSTDGRQEDTCAPQQNLDVASGPLKRASGGSQTFSSPSNLANAVVGFVIGDTTKCTSIQSSPQQGVTIGLFLTSDKHQGACHLGVCIGNNPAPWISSAIVDAASCIGTTNHYAAGVGSSDPNQGSTDHTGETGLSCFTGPSAADYANLEGTETGEVSAIAHLGANMTQLIQLTTDLSRNSTFASSTLKGYATAANVTATNLAFQVLQEFTVQNQTEERLMAVINLHQTNLQSGADVLASNAFQLAIEANATQNNFQKITAAMATSASNISATIDDLITQMGKNKITVFQQLRATQRLILAYNTVQQRFVLDDDLLNSGNSQIQAGLAGMARQTGASGVPLVPFLNDVGTAPAGNPFSLDPSVAYTFMSDQTFKYISTANTGYLTRLELKCNSNYMISKGPYNPTYRDILAMVGITGCDPTFTAGNYSCTCFIKVSESKCVINAGASNATIHQFLLAGTTITTGAGGCQTTPATGELDAVVATNSWQISDIIAAVSTRGVRANTFYTVSAALAGVQVAVPYNSDLNNSTMFYESLEESGTGTIDLAYAWGQNLELDYQSASTKLVYYKIASYGKLPNELTHEPILFRRFTSGDTGRGWRFSAMSYGTNYVTAASLVPGQVSTNVRITIDNVTSVVSDVTMTNPRQPLLRGVESMVYAPGAFSSSVYNIPNSEIEFSPFAGERLGKITHRLVSDLSKDTLADWHALNGVAFDHTAGGNVPYPYRIDLNSNPNDVAYGQCIGVSRIQGGQWCTLRQYFGMALLSNNLVLAAKTATIVAKVVVPEGPITQVLSSTCPLVQQVAVSGTALLVSLWNAAQRTNQIQVSQIGSCPFTRLVSIGPGSSTTLTLFSCSAAPVGSPDVVQISYLAASGQYAVCPGAIALDFTPQTAPRYLGAASLNLTVAIVQIKQDYLLAATETMKSNVRNALYQLIGASLQNTASLQFKIPTTTFDSYDNILAVLSANADQSAADAAAAASHTINLDQLFSDLDAELALSEEQMKNSTRDAQAQYDLLVQQNAATAPGVENLAILSRAVEGDIGDLAEKFDPFAQALIAAVNKSVREPQSNWISPTSDGNGGYSAAAAWGRAGDVIAGVPGSVLSGLFGGFPGFSSSLFGGGLLGLLQFLLVIAAIGAGTLVLGYIAVSYASQKHVYSGDVDAIKSMNEMLRTISIPSGSAPSSSTELAPRIRSETVAARAFL